VPAPRVGIDFDNTIVSYEGLFDLAVQELGLRRPDAAESKEEIRGWLRSVAGGEEQWQRAQAKVYGTLICQASEVVGFSEFVRSCRGREWPVVVVSHKTEFSAQDRSINLRESALGWMKAHGFFDKLGFKTDDVHFCATRREKLDRIRALGCTMFVDDLIEVLQDPMFPDGVDRILMSPNPSPQTSLTTVRSWLEVGDIVFS
jgi:hypothetical protein